MFLRKINFLLFCIFTLHTAQAKNLQEIAQELERVTHGYLSLKPEFESKVLEFKKNRRSKTYYSKKYIQYNILNDLFSFNPEIFMNVHGGSSFLESKLNFFRGQKKKKKLKRPYYYLSSWKSLGHPPIKNLTQENSYYDPFFQEKDQFNEDKRIFSPQLQSEIDQLTSTELTFGNELNLLVSGKKSIAKKIEMVKKSRTFFYSVVMVQYCDKHTLPYIDALIEKAKEGVDVRLIVEKVWTKLILKKCMKKLKKGGVKVQYSKGFFKPKTLFTVFHDKFWISDGREAIIGGQNMHNFENGSDSFNDHTLDKDVHVVGPAVTDTLGEFFKIWELFASTTDSQLEKAKEIYSQNRSLERVNGKRGKNLYDEILQDPIKRHHGVCRVIVQGDQTSRSLIGKTYLKLIDKLDHSLVFNTPSFKLAKKKLNGAILSGMQKRAKEGIRIRIVSNGVDGSYGEAGFQIRQFSDRLGNRGKHTLWRKTLQLERSFGSIKGKSVEKNLRKFISTENIEAYKYFNHVHAKQIIFDRALVSTGSYNFDAFSHRNHESTLLCFDKDLVEQSERQFVNEIVNSTPVLSL